jgi:hypothetical protein
LCIDLSKRRIKKFVVVLGTGLGIDLATRNELYANIKWAGIDRMYLSGSFKTAHSLAPKWDIH